MTKTHRFALIIEAAEWVDPFYLGRLLGDIFLSGSEQLEGIHSIRISTDTAVDEPKHERNGEEVH
jgi:hypothetical protein